MNKVLKSQLLGDLRTDLEERGEETHELPKPPQIPRRVLVGVLLEGDVTPLPMGSNHLSVSQTTGLCGGDSERKGRREET